MNDTSSQSGFMVFFCHLDIKFYYAKSAWNPCTLCSGAPWSQMNGKGCGGGRRWGRCQMRGNLRCLDLTTTLSIRVHPRPWTACSGRRTVFRSQHISSVSHSPIRPMLHKHPPSLVFLDFLGSWFILKRKLQRFQTSKYRYKTIIVLSIREPAAIPVRGKNSE